MAEPLTARHCVPCEGGVPPLSREEAERLVAEVPGWSLPPDGKSIERAWRRKDFRAAFAFAQRVGELAEAEGHHPDLHLTGCRNLRVALTTHAIGGLSDNDFILAAKINQLEAARDAAPAGQAPLRPVAPEGQAPLRQGSAGQERG